MSTLTVYSNDVELERAKQSSLPEGVDRLPKMRNRLARGKSGKLAVIALVAKERGDRTIEREARERLQALQVIEPGAKLAEVIEVRPSRRPSRSKEAQALASVPTQNAELDEQMDEAVENDTDKPQAGSFFDPSDAVV
jgi:hypothetical protein